MRCYENNSKSINQLHISQGVFPNSKETPLCEHWRWSKKKIQMQTVFDVNVAMLNFVLENPLILKFTQALARFTAQPGTRWSSIGKLINREY